MPNPGTRVYVGKLPYDARERDLEKFFKGYGHVREILMKEGFAFIEFEDHRDADDAVYELNGKDLLGERVHVEFAREQRGPRGRGGDRFGGGGNRSSRFEGRRYGPPRNTEYRVVVENLSSRVSWQDLKDYMRQAGEVTYADAHKRERNMGIVDFATYSDMKNAIQKLDGTDLQGRRIRLSEDKSRRSKRSRSRSHSRSRARRSRTRSRSPRSKSRSRSRSRSRSKSVTKTGNGKAHSKSRSRSRSRSRSPQSRSRSRSRSHSPMDAKAASRSRSRSRSKSRSVSKGRGDSRSRSRSPAGKRERSASPDRRRSRSRSGSRRSRSRSRSGSRRDSPRKSVSDHGSASERSRSRSRSASPPDEDMNGGSGAN